MDDLTEDKKLYNLIQKQVLTRQEFNYVIEHDFVSSLKHQPFDKKHPTLVKYVVEYINGNFDTIYLQQ